MIKISAKEFYTAILIAKVIFAAILIATLSIILGVNMLSGLVFFFAGHIWTYKIFIKYLERQLNDFVSDLVTDLEKQLNDFVKDLEKKMSDQMKEDINDV